MNTSSILSKPTLKYARLFLGVAAPLLVASVCAAADITATGSGNWTSTVADAPWPGGVVPASNDDVDVESPYSITNDSTATIDYIYGSGSVIMNTNSILTIVGSNAGQGTQNLGLLDTSSVSNSVIYKGNAFWCKHQNYYNLSLLGFGTLYTGNIGVPGDGQVPMTISGDMILDGTANMQQADNVTVNGNLTIGTNSTWDSSVGAVTILGNTIVNGTLTDYAGGPNLDNVFNNLTINPSGTWNLQDVIEWVVTGNLTNNGTIAFHDGAQITFTNNGVITGNPFALATLVVTGTNTISTTITATNFVGFGGGMVFDLASSAHQIIATVPLTYAGTLKVVNTGAAPAPGTSYQLFNAPSYSGGFDSVTLPALPAGLSWTDNLLTSGTITVTGSVASGPVITASQYDPTTHQFTLTWTSTPATTYSVLYSTNLVSDAFTSHTLATGIASGGAQTTTTVSVPANDTVGFLRISQP